MVVMGLEREEIEELLYRLVFGVLVVKYDLDRTGKKFDKWHVLEHATRCTSASQRYFRRLGSSLLKVL